MTLKEAVGQSSLSYRQIATLCGFSKTAATRGVNGLGWPRGRSETVRSVLEEKLAESGIEIGLVDWDAAMYDHEGAGPAVGSTQKTTGYEGTLEVELMQMDREILRLFGLRRNPFSNDIEDDADVWKFHGWQRVEDGIRDAVEERGFLAVIAHSGAGKTTIMEGVEAEMVSRDDVVWSKPHLMERDCMRADHLTHALIADIAGDAEVVRASMERRSRQLGRLLAQAYQEDRKVCLYIDDAHFCSANVLRQLKRYYEEKVGRFRLLAIVLVGLPQLKRKLSAFEEIGNRIRVLEVPPCPVDEYLEFKLGRVGSSPSKLFDEQGWAAFLGRFRARSRAKATARPLVINATCVKAMAALHRSGATEGERIGREIVDGLPGAAARRLA